MLERKRPFIAWEPEVGFALIPTVAVLKKKQSFWWPEYKWWIVFAWLALRVSVGFGLMPSKASQREGADNARGKDNVIQFRKDSNHE